MASDGAGAFDEVMKDDDTKVEKTTGATHHHRHIGSNIMGGAFHHRHIRRNVGVLTLFRHPCAFCVSTSQFPHLAFTRWPAAYLFEIFLLS